MVKKKLKYNIQRMSRKRQVFKSAAHIPSMRIVFAVAHHVQISGVGGRKKIADKNQKLRTKICKTSTCCGLVVMLPPSPASGPSPVIDILGPGSAIVTIISSSKY